MLIVNILLILALAALVSIRTNRRIESTIPFASLAIILFLFVLAVCGIMGFAIYAILLLGIFLFARYVLRWKNRSRISVDAVSLFVTPGLLGFLFFSVFMWWFSKDSITTQWDEFSHWALTIKDMYYTDRLSTGADALTFYKTYPPAMAIWQYFFLKLSGSYRESIVYYAYNMFLITMMMPAFQKITWKKIYCLPLVMIAVFCVPYLFYSPNEGITWACLFADSALAFCFCYALLSYFLEEKAPDGFTYLRTGMALAVLGLLKSSGNYTAAIAAVAIVVDAACKAPPGSLWKRFRSIAKYCCMMLGIWLFGICVWKLHLVIMKTPETWNTSRFSISALAALFTGKSESWHYDLAKLFWDNLSSVSTKAPGNITISYQDQPFVWLGILVCALLTAGSRDHLGRCLRTWGILLAGYAIYLCSLFFSYLFLFSQAEALAFSGMTRYTAVFWLGALAFSLFFLIDKLVGSPGPIRQILVSLLVLAFLYELAPVKQIKYDLEFHDTRAVRYAKITGFTVQEREYYKEVRSIVPSDAKIYIISDSQWFLIANYELYPNQTNVYGEHSFGEFDFNLTAELWRGKLLWEEYDYVWIDYANENFIESTQILFADEIKENTLYEIVLTETSIALREVYSAAP